MVADEMIHKVSLSVASHKCARRSHYTFKSQSVVRADDLYLFFCYIIILAVLTLCFILLHTCWGVVFFNGLEKKRYYQVVIVLLSHMLISCLVSDI